MTASPEWSARTRRQEERLPMRGAACVIEPNDDTREHVASLLRAMGFIAHETACGKLGQFIADQVKSWEVNQLIHMIELNVGKDLQYIRFNGTLIGGCAGVALHALELLLKAG